MKKIVAVLCGLVLLVGLYGCWPILLSPVAEFEWTVAGLSVTFDAGLSYDSDGNIVSYEWQFGDEATGIGPAPVHVYDDYGSYAVQLIVTDNDGKTGISTHTVTLVEGPINHAPVANFTWSQDGFHVDFDGGESNDIDGDIVDWFWLFGDGQEGGSGTGVSGESEGVDYSHVDHTYPNVARDYIVTLMVVNDDGLSDVIQHTITLVQSTSLTITHIDVSCNRGMNGSIDLSVSGGMTPYSYSWSPGGATTQDLNNLIAGTYTVTVMDANGCIVTRTVTITQPSSAVSASISAQTNADCFGGSVGSVTIAGAGGVAPYQYRLDGGTYQVSGEFTNLAAGEYIVTVKDSNGCVATQEVTVSQDVCTFTLTYTEGENGTIAGDVGQIVNYGADGSAVTATPNLGYHFVNWSDELIDNPRTDTNVANNIVVTANFAIDTHTLTYTADTNGLIDGINPQTVNYNTSGTPVTAIPNLGYKFVSWNDGVLTASRTDINVTDNISVTANFTINTFTLTYTAESHGAITGTSPQTVSYGANGTLVTAAPSHDYHFASWSDGVLTATRTDINVTGNIAVTATFHHD
jgi:hypothetical protein